MNSSSRSDRLLLFIGSLGYLGFVPFASGTVAVAVVGIPLYLLLVWLKLSLAAYVVFCVVLTAIAIYVAGRADIALNEKDSKKNVIDELPGYLIALIGLPATWQIVIVAFFIERAIDIAKVPPANWIEKRLPGGWGVVLDDVVAGLYSWGVLGAAIHFFPKLFGNYPI